MISSLKDMDITFIDWSKGVLAGASYGGYMASWFLGHDIIKEVCIPPFSHIPRNPVRS